MWHHFKSSLQLATGLNDSALHVVIGIAIYLSVVAVARRPWLSLAMVLVVQVLNEAWDLIENITRGGLAGALIDTVLTVTAPTFLALLMTKRRRT